MSIQIVELEHKTEEAKQLSHLADADEYKKERDNILKHINPDTN